MTSKFKIIYFIPDLQIGGAEKLLVSLINGLDNNIFDIILLTFSNKGKLFNTLKKDLKIYTTKNPFKILKILFSEKPDIFHSHLWRADIFGICLAKIANIKKCYSTRHNTNYFYGARIFLSLIDALTSRFFTKIICVSNAVKNFYGENFLYNKSKFLKIYNGINITPFINISKKNHSSIKLLTVANITKQKGIFEFLDILKNLNNIDYIWDIVGNGPLKGKILNKIKQLGLENKVIIHGSKKDIVPFLENSDIFILPSLWEGFGLVLVEAIASNTFVFASNVGGIKEIITENETGILFNPKRKDETIEKLRKIILEKLYKPKENNTRNINLENFTLDTMLKNYTHLYKNENN